MNEMIEFELEKAFELVQACFISHPLRFLNININYVIYIRNYNILAFGFNDLLEGCISNRTLKFLL